VDPQPHNVLFSDKNRISFLNCDLVGLPTGAKENLQSYFNAMLADDPDRAAMYLLREMSPTKAMRIDPESFRSSFRQAAYFGMLEPILGTNSNALAQIVFQHWKTAQEHGYSPKPHLLCFYRGLFSIARLARKLSPAGDPLREGMDELRATSAFSQLREIMDWRYWFQNSDKFASALMHLPHTFDDALTKAAAPQPSNFPNHDLPAPRERRGILSIALVILLILVFAFSQLPGFNAWSEKITMLALMLTGLLVLRGLDT
jgi:predicted unusual protein kinase regulating ubiquinone biosynthesis (AarF/ABC1/UbiB family)